MPRGRGIHYKTHEIKKAIIEYLLNQSAEGVYPAGMVYEPVLRAYLRDKFSISEQKNIKNHLKDLLKSGCLKKRSSSGLSNEWFIDDIKQIRKIAEFFDDEIVPILNKSDVAVDLVRDSVLGNERIRDLYEDSYSSVLFYNSDIPRWFKLSPSFFEFCLYNDIETINKRWEDYYLLTDVGVAFIERRIRFKGQSNSNFFEERFFEAMEKIFEHCVLNDVLNGWSNPEAIEHLKSKKKERIEVTHSSDKIYTENHDRKILTTISWHTRQETYAPILGEPSGKPHLSFGQMEEDAKLSLMSDSEKEDYFKKNRRCYQ